MKIFSVGVDLATIAMLGQQGIVATAGEDIESPEDVVDFLDAELDAVVVDLTALNWSLLVVRYLRNKRQLPVVGISKGFAGMTWSDERATWLEHGGDDYLRGPVNPRELGASLRSLARRVKHGQHDFREYRFGEAILRIDLGTTRATVNGVEPHLTASERIMLMALATNSGRLVTKEKFLSELYAHEQDEAEMKIIDVFICKIRKKLGAIHPDAEKIIETVWGKGYQILEPMPHAVAAKVA